MRLKRMALKAANGILERAGLSVQGTRRDFDARLESPSMLRKMFRQLASEADAWLTRQSLFDPLPLDTEKEIERFYGDYLRSPFRQRFGGNRFNNLMWLFLLARSYSPSVVVDSGTYQGASAWALRLGAPGVPLYSFDIDMSQLSQRIDVHYVESDWSTFAFGEDVSRGLAFFDDHQDQARRLLESRERGFRLAVFDDDYPVTGFAGLTQGARALPKVEFVLDDELRREREIVWQENGTRMIWPVDAAYLDKARETIAATDRLPDTSVITCIPQIPLRVAKLRA
jgi:hypothetical protein